MDKTFGYSAESFQHKLNSRCRITDPSMKDYMFIRSEVGLGHMTE